MQNDGRRHFVFAKIVILATLSTLMLVFILVKFQMTAASILNFGQTTIFGHSIYFLVIYYTYVASF